MMIGIIASQNNEVKTFAPTINNVTTSTFRYTVTNNDPMTATIYADHDQSNPTTSRGSIASNGNTSTINTLVSAFLGSSVTIYAKAQASGKIMSDIVSLYIEV